PLQAILQGLCTGQRGVPQGPPVLLVQLHHLRVQNATAPFRTAGPLHHEGTSLPEHHSSVLSGVERRQSTPGHASSHQGVLSPKEDQLQRGHDIPHQDYPGPPRNRTGSHHENLSQRPLRHQEVNSKDTIVCRKRCPQKDVDCILNETQTITFQTLALPTVPYLPQPLILTTMRAVAMSGNVRFGTDYRILEGNERQLFDILKGQGVGSLRLTRALHGPDELLLKVLMTIYLNPNSRLQFVSSTQHLAYIHVIVSEYDF
ncbi:uncharacterized protein TNCT_712521, partial [Trichonephila clavata]